MGRPLTVSGMPGGADGFDPTSLPKIQARSLKCVFPTKEGERIALEEVSFDILQGSFVCIVGPSGCGKSTLLRILAGLQRVAKGTLEIDRDSDSKPLTAMVFQEQQSVLPWLTVRDNIEFGLRMRHVNAKVRTETSNQWLERIGLTEYADSYPQQISGGMKQRVNVARAFAADPEILLMDEPFASLDQQNKVLLQEDLLTLWEGSRKTVVYVTHDIEEAVALGDSVYVMSAVPGRIMATYVVEFERPRDLTRIRLERQFHEKVFEIGRLIRSEVLRSRR